MNENLLNLNKVCSPKKKKSTFPSNHSIQSIHQSNPMKIYPCIEEKGIHTHTLLPEQQQQFFFLHAARIQCQCLIQTTHTITKKKKKKSIIITNIMIEYEKERLPFFFYLFYNQLICIYIQQQKHNIIINKYIHLIVMLTSNNHSLDLIE